jgi:hypothetical protein
MILRAMSVPDASASGTSIVTRYSTLLALLITNSASAFHYLKRGTN